MSQPITAANAKSSRNIEPAENPRTAAHAERPLDTEPAAGPGSAPRNQNVTIAKGIGIILMVVGHSGAPAFLHNVIYAFHMPLFFLLAGYCFKTSHLSDPLGFTKKRLRGLWWPFLKWNLIFMLLHNWFASMNLYSTVYTLRDVWHRLGWFPMMKNAEELLGGFWFLCGLFVASMAGWGILRLCKGRVPAVAAATALLAVATAVANIWVTYTPTGYRPTNFMCYTVFFLSGYLMAAGARRRPGYASGTPLGITVALTAVLLLVAWLFPYGISALFTWELPIYLIGGVAGTAASLAMASRLRDGRIKAFLVFCGESTMTVLIWHFLCFKGVTALLLHLHGMPMAELTAFPVHPDFPQLWWLYTAVGLFIPLLLKQGWRAASVYRLPQRLFSPR